MYNLKSAPNSAIEYSHNKNTIKKTININIDSGMIHVFMLIIKNKELIGMKEIRN